MKPLYQIQETVRTQNLESFTITDIQPSFDGFIYVGSRKRSLCEKELIRLIYSIGDRDETLLDNLNWHKENSANGELIDLLLKIVFTETKYSNNQEHNYQLHKKKYQKLMIRLYLSYFVVGILLSANCYLLLR